MSRLSSIERYVPDELLGSAGLVDTYRAHIQGGQGLVALKVLFLDRAESSVTRPIAESFLVAARRAVAASLPGAAEVLEVSDDVDAAFVASEFMPGVDLACLVQRVREHGAEALEPEVGAAICAQVARVLGAAHERKPPLFHLGLSPQNVVVDSAGEVRVLDFGVGASLRGAAGCPFEKWHFVAPELIGVDANSLPAEAARAADLYSLGALLHFLLSGRKPVEASTLAELSEGIWEPLPDTPDIPKNLLAAVRALTAFEPSDRPASARIVVEWLGRGGDVTREQRARVATALETLAIRPEPSSRPEAQTAPARPSGQSAALDRWRASVASRRRSGAKVGSAALRGPRRPSGRLSRVLFAGGVLLAAGIVVLGAEIYRGSRRQAPQGKADEAPLRTTPKSQAIGQAEVSVARPTEGASNTAETKVNLFPPAPPYLPADDRTPSRLPNHLFLDTSPSQADVWVDGALRGKTPVDLVVGPGSHRVVVVKAGYRMLQAVFDTTKGEYARRGLQRAGFPRFGDGIVDVQCESKGKYPVLIDDEETGLLCPVSALRLPSGKHTIGIFVPSRRAAVTVEVVVSPGRQPKRVTFSQ